MRIEYENAGQFMDAMTQEYAQKTFLIFDGRRISYQEFARDVKKSSSLLAKTGIKKGSKIALLMENSPEYLYLFFGCMRMGAVVCPISTRLSEREIGYIYVRSHTREFTE